MTEEPVYDTSTVRSSNKQDNKCRNLQLVEGPKRKTDKVHHNHDVANTTITDDSTKAIENTDDIMDTKLNCTLLKISSVLQEIRLYNIINISLCLHYSNCQQYCML